ncbi:MAG: TatD family hydrolase [Candidatus Liptonbacteria bacterium]|nr:TatD family hydrolase [Candidatus Liptonbacteria bacterium]
MNLFFDSHTHINSLAYDADRDEVMRRAKTASVKMITVGTQESASRGAVEFAKKHKGDVWAAVGFHPAHFSVSWYHDKNEQEKNEREILNIEELRNLAIQPEVVAIGECGLDYFRVAGNTEHGARSVEQQKAGFIAQIELAHEVKKPLMIHCRNAFPDLIAILHSNLLSLISHAPGVIHFFTGTTADAKALLDLGFSFTFGGAITFPPRKGKQVGDYDEVVKMIPLDRILSETDAPYVSPAQYRGKRNEPAYVIEVVKKLAELKGVPTEEMARRIWDNAVRIFSLESRI